MAVTYAAQEVKWIQQLWNEMIGAQTMQITPVPARRILRTTIYTDNQSAIQIGKNNMNHSRSKHIQLRYHFVRDDLVRGVYELKWCSSVDNLADMFTKALGAFKFNNDRVRITGGC